MADDIHKLWRKVQEHPDYIGGTLFVRGDLPKALHDRLNAGTLSDQDEEKLRYIRKALENAEGGNEDIATLTHGMNHKCPNCQGSGETEADNGTMHDCWVCHGEGELPDNVSTFGMGKDDANG